MKKMWILAMSFLCIFLVGCGDSISHQEQFELNRQCEEQYLKNYDYDCDYRNIGEHIQTADSCYLEVFYSPKERECVVAFQKIRLWCEPYLTNRGVECNTENMIDMGESNFLIEVIKTGKRIMRWSYYYWKEEPDKLLGRWWNNSYSWIDLKDYDNGYFWLVEAKKKEFQEKLEESKK